MNSIMNKNLITWLLLIFIGCSAPDTIVLNRIPEGNTIVLTMLNGIEKAEEINHNSFRILPNSIISLKFIEATQNTIQFELIPQSTGKIEFFLYTTSNNFPEKAPIKLELSDNGYSIIKENKLIAQSDKESLSPNKKKLIKLQKDANLLKITINCDVIIASNVILNATEYMIIRTDENLNAIIQRLDYSKNY
jgi:hypothetical protein